MATIPQFNPHANVNDFTSESQKRGLSDRIAGFVDRSIESTRPLLARGEPSQFYNPMVTDTSAPHAERVIDWIGFPKLVEQNHPGDFLAACSEAEGPANN